MVYITTIEQRQLYKYHMSNYLSTDYPFNLSHLKTLVIALLRDPTINENVRLRLKDGNYGCSYESMMKSIRKFDIAYSYVNNLVFMMKELVKGEPKSPGNQKSSELDDKVVRMKKSMDKYLRGEILAVCQVLPTIEEHLVLAQILCTIDTNLKDTPISQVTVEAKKLNLEGVGEPIKVRGRNY